MKQLSGFLLIIMAWLTITSAACKKDKHPLADAVITGYDPRYCNCCGGLMINFENNPAPLSGEFSLLANTPASLGITEDAVFPLYVRVAWKKTSTCGEDDIVTITRFERR